MATRTLHVPRPLSSVWADLQKLEVWEGLGGLNRLRNGRWDETGNLLVFSFSLETPLGTIRDRATVSAASPKMTATADAKGIAVDVELELETAESLATAGTHVAFSIRGRSTSFLTRALVGPLSDTLEAAIDDERDTLAERLTPGRPENVEFDS